MLSRGYLGEAAVGVRTLTSGIRLSVAANKHCPGCGERMPREAVACWFCGWNRAETIAQANWGVVQRAPSAPGRFRAFMLALASLALIAGLYALAAWGALYLWRRL